METLTPTDLNGFTGSEIIYRHPFQCLLYTEGVQHLAKTVGAYWLLDTIALNHIPLNAQEPFMSITLEVSGKKRAVLTATDGNHTTLKQELIPYTDFPPGEWRLFLCDGVLMLPSEY